MAEHAIAWMVWAAQKILFPGLLVALVLKLVSHTKFYEKYLASPIAVVKRYVLGPRLQIHAAAIREGGFSHLPFSILRVEITNQPDITYIPLLQWKLPDRVQRVVNSVIPCKVLENGRAYRRFFNREWVLIPEPQREGAARGLPWGDWVWELPLGDKTAVDVAGLSTRGDCFGTRTNIGQRWLFEGTGDPDIDLPLEAGDDYYVEVSVGNDQTRITYAVSHFLLRHRGTVDTFELLPVILPAEIPKVKYGEDRKPGEYDAM